MNKKQTGGGGEVAQWVKGLAIQDWEPAFSLQSPHKGGRDSTKVSSDLHMHFVYTHSYNKNNQPILSFISVKDAREVLHG